MMRQPLFGCHADSLGFIAVHGGELLSHVLAFFRKRFLHVGKLPSGMGQTFDRDHRRRMAPVGRERIADLQRRVLFGRPPLQQFAHIFPGVLTSTHVQHDGGLCFVWALGDDAGGV